MTSLETSPPPAEELLQDGDGLRESAGRDFLMRRLLALVDGLAICAAILLTAKATDNDVAPMLAWGALLIPAWTLLFKLYGLYDRDEKKVSHGTFDEIPWLVHAVLVGSILMWALYSFLPILDLGFGDMLMFGGIALVLVAFGRLIVRGVGHMILPPERVLFAGLSASVLVMSRKMKDHPEYALRPVGLLADDLDPDELLPPGVQHIGSLDQLPEIAAALRIDRLVIAAEALDDDRVVDLTRVGNEGDLKVSILPSMHDALGPSVTIDSLEGLAVLALHPVQLSRSSRMFKRCIDVVLASTALILLSPLLLVTALAIRIDSRGPILFRQRRIGLGGYHFNVLKFRTMVPDAEQRVADLMAESKDPNWLHLEHDPRITRVGRTLRQYSIDELPQLWNVVKGDMSLVGPRPLSEDEDRRIEGWGRRRLDLVPGITGMWQVLGRTNIPFEEMVKLDYLYVMNWSLWSDLKILAQTLPVVLGRRGVN